MSLLEGEILQPAGVSGAYSQDGWHMLVVWSCALQYTNALMHRQSSLIPRPPSFGSSVCSQHNTQKQHSGMCITMNANRRTKMGEAWEQGLQTEFETVGVGV